MRRTEPNNFTSSTGPTAEADAHAIEPGSAGVMTNQRSALTLDVARYEVMLDDPSLSTADRAAFLEALWNIIVSFIDLGFHIHPLQQVKTPAGMNEDDTLEILAMSPAEMVKLDGLFPRKQFAKAVSRRIDDGREEEDS